jgi:hypothetical protein
METSSRTCEFAFGQGTAICDAGDGSVLAIRHPSCPRMEFLLSERESAWHHSPFYWGKGFVMTDRGAGRWDAPQRIEILPDGIRAAFEPLPGLRLEVERRFGTHWSETYRLVNERDHPLAIRSLAISVPYRDIYPSAQECLESACHAHIWAGGTYAYVWAVRMDGQGPGLGLALEQGELWSYSVETRSPFTSSNVRGHLYLHVTDAGRTPHAFGGQPEILLQAGASYELSWRIGWYPDFATFEREALHPPVTLPALTALVGEPLSIHSAAAEEVTLQGIEEVAVQPAGPGEFAVYADRPGVKHIDVRWGDKRSRVAVLFHRTLRETVERRIAFILAHQRAVDRSADRHGAFLPYDVEWGLTINGGDWYDWSDARERLAMPILLQLARLRGWGDTAEIDAALADFDRYCWHHLVDEEGTVFEDSFHRTPRRLYNFPWMAEFYLNQYRLGQRREDLLLASQIVERYYALGGGRFLAFVATCALDVIAALEAAREEERAARLRVELLRHADHFIDLGTGLPSHEVNYEQTVVAPLVQLLEAAYRLHPQARYADALRARLPWLLAFAGQQPHVRLRHIAIRHWDGYWFGRYRCWGDTMPHYWTVQSAAALLDWPPELGGPEDLDDMAHAIFKANLAHFYDDGSATCAFVLPGCVNGNPAYVADPIANDQDWALVYYCRYSA